LEKEIEDGLPAGLDVSMDETPVHVKSLPAHAIRALITARKKLVSQRVTLENQIRGLAVVFGVRLPRALTPAFVKQALKASEGVPASPPPCRATLRRGAPCSPPSWRSTPT
jgi:transposase